MIIDTFDALYGANMRLDRGIWDLPASHSVAHAHSRETGHYLLDEGRGESLAAGLGPSRSRAVPVSAVRHPSHVQLVEAAIGAISQLAAPRGSGLRGSLRRRIEVMTKLFGWVAATVIGAAIVTATPAASFRESGGFGGMRMGRQISVGGFHNPAFFRHHRHFHNVVFVGGPFFYDYVPYYYDYVPYHGNYCWQQVWTLSGWQWVDACSGYYGYGY